jgi:2-polyprenyl-3-methyl-5-hydroxy-6-metoxy-1,4-benzoquinol methylase
MEEKEVTERKSDSYYSIVNQNILKMIRGSDNVVLDVGCGHGALGRVLKCRGIAKYVLGIEKDVNAAEAAKEYIDEVICKDVQQMTLKYEGVFDYIILSHVLEHFYEPLRVLEGLKRPLKQDGWIIAGLPNIRYWRVLRDLILFDKWEYHEAGILDSTHVRFYTLKSAERLFFDAKYSRIRSSLIISGEKQRIANFMSINLFRGFLASEIYVMATKS